VREFKDKSGRVIKRGDIIVYAVSYGRSPGLSYGKVLDIVATKSEYARQKTKVKVMGVDRSYTGTFHANSKPGLLEYSDRMLVVFDGSQVPEDALKKLDAIELPPEEETEQ
jgi:hypothetical protein